MITKTIIEEVNCSTEDAPVKTFEAAVQSFKQAAKDTILKDQICFTVNVKQGQQASEATFRFISKEIANGSPEEQTRKAMNSLLETLLKGMVNATKGKEENHD